MEGIRINNLHDKVIISVDTQKIEAFRNMNLSSGSGELVAFESTLEGIMLKIKSAEENEFKKVYVYVNEGNKNIMKYTLSKQSKIEEA